MFYGEGTYLLLNQMVENQMTTHTELYDKLWERLDQGINKAKITSCVHNIKLLQRYQELLPQNQN